MPDLSNLFVSGTLIKHTFYKPKGRFPLCARIVDPETKSARQVFIVGATEYAVNGRMRFLACRSERDYFATEFLTYQNPDRP